MWSPGRALAAALVMATLPSAAVADKKPRGKKPPAQQPGEPAADPRPPTAPSRAEQLFNDGRKYLSAKEYALACTAFEQSQAAEPAVGTQLNLGLCFEEWGKTASAYRAFIEAERLATVHRDDRAVGARDRIAALSPRVPHLALLVAATVDPATVLLVDEKPVARDAAGDLLLDPGAHTIEMRVPGREPLRATTVLADGERKQVTLALPAAVTAMPPSPTARRRRPARFYGGIAAGVVGLGAVATASIIALGARSDYADAIGACPGGVCTTEAAFDATQDARRTTTRMTYVAAGGLVVLGVGVALLLTSTERADAGAVAVAPIVTRDLVGLSLGGAL